MERFLKLYRDKTSQNCENYSDVPSTVGTSEDSQVESQNSNLIDHEEILDGGSDSTSDGEHELAAEVRQTKKLKKNYKQKWKEDYSKKFGTWLVSTEKKESYCRACKTIINGGASHLKRHSQTLKHVQRLKALQNTPKIQDLVASSTQEKLHQQVKLSEISLIMFVAEHNLPFLILDHLSSFLKTVCPDSEVAKNIKMGRKKGTFLCKTVISEEQRRIMQLDLKNKFYSIIVDETTDVSVKSSLVIVVRYFDNDKPQERFLGLIEVKNKTADGLYSSITEFLNLNKLDTKNLIGFAADNANVMMGNKTGLKAKFKENFPNIFIFGCICHSFSLCASAASEKIPSHVEKLARNIYGYFKLSSNRLGHLKECQIFLNIKPHRLLRLCQTRWLSLQQVVDRILEQYDALMLFFTNESFDKKNDENADDILQALKNPINKLYYMFLSYVLHLVNMLNLEFQSATLKLHRILEHVSSMYRTIARNFILPQKISENVIEIPINNPHFYLSIEKIYLGPKCEMFILENNVDSQELQHLKTSCLNFYIELLNQIKSRVPFDDPVLNDLQFLNPPNVFNGKCESLIPLLRRFPMLTNNFELVETEYRLLQNCSFIKEKSDEPVLQFWNSIFKLKSELDELMFPNLKQFIAGLMSLPHSSACAERIFSRLFLIKSKTRNRLSISSCDALLRVKELLGENVCFNFKPSLSLLRQKINYKESHVESDGENLTF